MHNVTQANNPESFKRDATLLVLNSHNNISKEIKFNGVFPTALSSLEFDSQAPGIEMLQVDISFAYTNFEFKA